MCNAAKKEMQNMHICISPRYYNILTISYQTNDCHFCEQLLFFCLETARNGSCDPPEVHILHNVQPIDVQCSKNCVAAGQG
jgi:hypothetical protein